MASAQKHSSAAGGGGGSTVARTCVLCTCVIVSICVLNGYAAIAKCGGRASSFSHLNPLQRQQPQPVLLSGLQNTAGGAPADGTLEQHCEQQSAFPNVKVAQRPVLIYVGSSNLGQPGFVSYNYSELDITKSADFKRLFCPESVDIFFSEHTLEHIPIDQYPTLFGLFLQYLKPGGFVRIAIPTFSDRHVPSEVDKSYGHVGTASAQALESEMQSAGFANVTILEQVHFVNGQRKGFTSKLWDECEGRVRRSFRHDHRNVPYLKERYAALELVNTNEINDVVNSTEFPPVLSTIVQGHRPFASGGGSGIGSGSGRRRRW